MRPDANGRQLALVNESTGTSGNMALYAESRDVGLDARFDSFGLYRAR